MHPRKTTDLSNLISANVEWGDKWANMEKDYSKEIELPPMWKMAALMEVCPEEVQDVIYQNMDEVHEDYERTRQTLFTWVSNKVAARVGPVSVDVGKVEQFSNYGSGYEEYEAE